VHVRVRVVAVAPAAARIGEAVAVVVLRVALADQVVGDAVAVVVYAVAALAGGGVPVAIGVAAVARAERVVRHRVARDDGACLVVEPEAVRVVVGVPGHRRRGLVDVPVAVVVLVVADLELRLVDLGVAVVAVVVLDAERRCPGTRRHRAGRVAVQVVVVVREAHDQRALVDVAIAVVVEGVADLREAGAHVAAAVAAVVTAGALVAVDVAARRVDEAVAVSVAVAEGRQVAVLVPVRGVADLRVPGEAVGIGVVAVGPAAVDRVGPVPVGVGDDVAEAAAALRLLVAALSIEAGILALDAAEAVGALGRRRAPLLPVAEESVVALGLGAAHARAVRRWPRVDGGRVVATRDEHTQAEGPPESPHRTPQPRTGTNRRYQGITRPRWIARRRIAPRLAGSTG